MPTLTIESLSTQGEGIARHEGMVHFVPRTLPGELCQVEVIESKKNWCRALPRNLESSSPDRVTPSCPIYDRCGGCQLQHVRYEAQCAFKQQSLTETLKRIGHIEIQTQSIVPSFPLNYRRKVTFSLMYSEEQLKIALHAWDNPKELVEVHSCLLLDPSLENCIPQVELWLNGPEMEWVKKGISRIVLQRLKNQTALVLLTNSLFRSKYPPTDLPLPQGIDSIYLAEDRQGASYKLLNSRTENAVFPGAFRQTNPFIANQLYKAVGASNPNPGGQVIDAYAGSGELSFLLAESARQVIAIELDRQTVQAARQEMKSLSIMNRIQFLMGRTENLLGKNLPADYVVLDPPRAGCDIHVIQTLIANKPSGLAYISCHPAALARDLRRFLDGGFQIKQIIPFDMFPQTYHLEVLAILER